MSNQSDLHVMLNDTMTVALQKRCESIPGSSGESVRVFDGAYMDCIDGDFYKGQDILVQKYSNMSNS